MTDGVESSRQLFNLEKAERLALAAKGGGDDASSSGSLSADEGL